MANPVEIEFRSDGTDSVSREVERYSAALSNAQEAASGLSTASQETAESTNQVGSKSAFAVEGLADLKAGFDFAKTAAVAAFQALKGFGDEMERQLGVANRLAGNIDVASAAVGGMVSNIDLMIARNRLAASGLDLTEQQFADIAEVATDYAAAVGGDAVQSTERLGNVLMSMSENQLRRFGIEVDRSTSFAEQQAEALEQLRQRAAEMETGADTAGGAFARMGVEIENAQTRLLVMTDLVVGQSTPAFEDLSRAVLGNESALGRYMPTLDTFVDMLAIAGLAVVEIIERLAELIQSFRDLDATLAVSALNIRSFFHDWTDRYVEIRDQSNLTADTVETDTQRAVRAMNEITARVMGMAEAQATAAKAAEAGAGRRSRATRSAAAVDHRTSEQRIADMLAEQQGQQEAEAARQAMQAAELQRDHEREVLAQLEHNRRQRAIDDLRAQREERERLLATQVRAANEQAKLVEQAHEAAMTFRTSWVGGVASVSSALDQANAAAEAAGTNMVSAMDAAAMGVRGAVQEMSGALVGQLASGFAAAIQAAAKGEKSFGEAMEAMLEDTLYAVGQQALIQSLFYFAKAIADAASQNYAQVPLDLAAGAAFAGVAVAGFAGGAAVSAARGSGSTAAATPTEPQQGASTGNEGGGNTYNITLSGPIATAGTRAELGRDLKSYIGESDRRFGRAA